MKDFYVEISPKNCFNDPRVNFLDTDPAKNKTGSKIDQKNTSQKEKSFQAMD